MDSLSFIRNAHPQYIEQLYRDYQKDPDSVNESWRNFFKGYEFAMGSKTVGGSGDQIVRKEMYVLNLINGYRSRGHFFTKTNPVRERRYYRPTLDLENFNLTGEDLDTVFEAGSDIGLGPATLRDIVAHLEETYCRSIGAEYMFVRTPERIQWLKERMESTRNTPQFSIEEKRQILHKLNQTVIFENFLHTKFTGQKRFSLEGGETLIPGLDALIEYGSEVGAREFVIGMPHRGRLSVLANILNKSYEEIFSEFEGQEYVESVFGGDVKYHLGYSSVITTRTGRKVKVGLAPNPSHLEAVNPVVEGMARAKLEFSYAGDEDKIIPVLIHGDAAIAAQGVVYEVIQMSELEGYRTGGTIHLVINNQLGFTTNYLDGRSSTYCTDVAKVTRSPVFHVNADDAEAVVFAIKMAVEYRQVFHTDVFIDLLGYRKYGHNEGDEPRFTQPKLYSLIAAHPNPREIYKEKLLKLGSLEEGMAREMEKEFREKLQEKLMLARQSESGVRTLSFQDTCDLKRRNVWHSFDPLPESKVKKELLLKIGKKVFGIPPEIKVFEKISKLYEERYNRLIEGTQLDWAIGELLAYGTLVNEKIPVRISGQDSERGTFSHRHAVVYDTETESEYVPLKNIQKKQAPFNIFNSLLSEFGVLGFEYGYACANPDGLTIWEAQFGDFSNEAQVIIDQFIASGEAKWNRTNGVVLFLPHGYEGQGPEHSSARMERFLTLAAGDNIMVANCTTPANFFHLLRSHVKYPFRFPLVVFTPKSLLRHPRCVSPLEAFTEGGFQRVIDDDGAAPEAVKTVLFCSGKIYYELLEFREKKNRSDVAVVRVEQLYPFPQKELKTILKKYKSAETFRWVQEEPANAGALAFMQRKFDLAPLTYVSRRESATPASGFFKHHVSEQKRIIEKAFA